MIWYLWLFLFLLFLGIEIITTGLFFSLCFSFGALIAMTSSLFGATNVVSAVIFCVVSLICVIVIRPLMKKYIEKYKVQSNVDALVGCPAVVVEEIKPNKKGKVKIAGEVWSAISEEEFKTNDVATVVSVDGTKLVVKKNIK